MQGQKSSMQKKIMTILGQIEQARTLAKRDDLVRLVAVSKTKTVEEIKAAYDFGIRNFGENYVDQIEAKQPKLPLDIKWHFIGHLQSNKIKKLMVPNLQYIQTVDRASLAQKLQKYLEKNNAEKILKILIQVKTSDQQSKSGASEEELLPLIHFIYDKCPNLMFKGLMTIGKQGDEKAFLHMNQLKKKVLEFAKISEKDFQLSMGMSADFQNAIQYGSTSVRVGSSIFGPRSYPKKQEEKVEQSQLP